MTRIFSFVALLLVAAAVLYLYSTQIRSTSFSGASTPKEAAELTGVRADLIQIQRIEQQHLASDGHYLTLAEMHEANDTGLPPDQRGNYRYEVSVEEGRFTAMASYVGTPPAGTPRTLRIGPEGVLAQE